MRPPVSAYSPFFFLSPLSFMLFPSALILFLFNGPRFSLRNFSAFFIRSAENIRAYGHQMTDDESSEHSASLCHAQKSGHRLLSLHTVGHFVPRSASRIYTGCARGRFAILRMCMPFLERRRMREGMRSARFAWLQSGKNLRRIATFYPDITAIFLVDT